MPAIYLFQRRTLYGGDDLHLLALVTATARCFQLICYAVLTYHIVYHVQQSNVYWAEHGATTSSGGRSSSGGGGGNNTTTRRRFLSTGEQQLQQQQYSNYDNTNQRHYQDQRNPSSWQDVGISLLEYAWMDAVNTNSETDCRHSHLFPLLLMTYTAAGMVFAIASLILLYQIYHTSSQGCPTLQRHPRTEKVEQYLEWLFFPINILHFVIWISGLSAMVLGIMYAPCDGYDASTWFRIVWIVCGVACWITQGVEILWNFMYLFHLVYRDPHALLWTPLAPLSNSTAARGAVDMDIAMRVAHHNHELVEEMWAERCHNWCRCLGMGTCYMFGGRELYGSGAMHYDDIARALADYLETRGVLDVVPSDIMVGFLVLNQLQIQRRHQQRQHVLHEHSQQSLYTSNNSSRRTADESGPFMGTTPAPGRITSPSSSTSSSSTPSSSRRLKDHRATASANSPNGMQLQRSRSSDKRGTTAQNTPQTPLQPKPPAPSLVQASNNAGPNNSDAPSTPLPSNHDPCSPSLPFDTIVDEQHKGYQRVLSQYNHFDMHILQEGARYSKYALAIYTWYLYVYVHPITGIPKLCMRALKDGCTCCFCSGRSASSSRENNGMATSISSASLHAATTTTTAPTAVASNTSPLRGQHTLRRPSRGNSRLYLEDDNICQAHKHALLLTAGLQNETDLVYVQLRSSLNENPYCILLDHETQAVVVAVRGTFSLEDCVTDVLLEPENLEALGDEFGFADIAKNQYCHGGVLSCARNVYRDLQRHGYLEYLLGTKYPHYSLCLVGHSLGAACSTMLGFMLRQTYPSLKCFNYSPPGCTLTWEMATACQPWCTSFVLDSEVVPRLSFEALELLRDEVLELIGRIKVPKVEVARRVATHTFWCTRRSRAPTRGRDYDIEQSAVDPALDEIDDILSDLLLPADQAQDINISSYRQQLEQFQAIQSERRTSRGTRRAIRLFPPGRMLHLVKTDEKQSCWIHLAKCVTCFTTNAGSQYTPVWIGNADLQEIVVSPTMGTDHFPNRMVEELQGVANDFALTF